MTDQNPADELTAKLMAEGLLNPSEVRTAALASQMVTQIHRIAYSMTVEDALNLVVQAEKMLKGAHKTNADPLLIEQYRQGAQAARAFLKFRRDLERLRA